MQDHVDIFPNAASDVDVGAYQILSRVQKSFYCVKSFIRLLEFLRLD
jgi:hypothetical protein